eukprot:gb/GECG01003622.1/.p1 GENE.gb/GECG01003622.1/~~gb/GECG01003622.1/.p1  ORF type:complete len:583 (+),score=70.31 gb/GECG01003622.1/:1-1749(+)
MSRSAIERSQKRKAKLGIVEPDDPFDPVDEEQEENEGPQSLPIWGSKRTLNMEKLLANNIVTSDYFRSLKALGTFNEVVDEIYTRVEYVEPWAAGTARAPSSAFCLLFKIGCLRITKKQLMTLLNHKDSPYIRAIGFLYVRYTMDPKELWAYFKDYTEDPQEFAPSTNYKATQTMGEFVMKLIGERQYYNTLLPRIPVPVQRDLEVRLAIVAEDKLRADFHCKHMDQFVPKARVKSRYSEDDEWYDATLVEAISDLQDRWLVKYDEYEETEERSIGQLDLLDPQYSFKYNHEGRGLSASEMAQKLRELERQKATTSGKAYAHRPASLKGALSMKLDSYSYRKDSERSFTEELTQITTTNNPPSSMGPVADRKKKRRLRLDDDGPFEYAQPAKQSLNNKNASKEKLGRDTSRSHSGRSRKNHAEERREPRNERHSRRDRSESPQRKRSSRRSRSREGSLHRGHGRRNSSQPRSRSRSPRRTSRRSPSRSRRRRSRSKSRFSCRSRSRSKSPSRRRSVDTKRSKDKSPKKPSPSSDDLSLSSRESRESWKDRYQSSNTADTSGREKFADHSLVDEDIVNIGSLR